MHANGFKYYYCLHTVKWFQVLLCNTNNSINYQLFICTHLNGSISSTDETLTGITTPGLSEPKCNGNKGVLHIPQSSRSGASSPDAV